MTSDRGRTQAVKTIIPLQEPGGFTLPADLLTALELPAKVRAVPLPSPEPFDTRNAADEMLHQLERGETPDLSELARRVSDTERARLDVMAAQRVAADALEQAESVVLGVVADGADRIVTDCLRPAFEANLDEARKHSGALAGQPLDPMALITAPAKTRAAWAAVGECTNRYRVLREAHRLVNAAGLRLVQHDTEGRFGTFERPAELFPGYEPGGSVRMPVPEFPSDPVDLMVWLVGPAAVARPWLPTAAQQDAAWQALYGEAAEMRRQTAQGAWPAVRSN